MDDIPAGQDFFVGQAYYFLMKRRFFLENPHKFPLIFCILCSKVLKGVFWICPFPCQQDFRPVWAVPLQVIKR